MSGAGTIKLIESYLEQASAPMFLSGFFRSPPENFHTSEEVEFDVQRDDELVAVVIADLTAGPRKNEASVYTSKRLKPPIYDEEIGITAFDMIARQFGQNPFTDPQYAANALRQAFSGFRKVENKIRRAIEWQASQVLQTGKLSLIDKNGIVLYELDFQPKATHIKTVTTTWAANGATGDPLGDLEGLADVVRRDGKRDPFRLVFGKTAWQRFGVNAAVKSQLDLLRSNTIAIAPESRGQGATFQGNVWIGNYRFEMWTYSGYFKHPQTGAITPYVHDEKVIMNGDGRMDLTFGAIPMIVPPDQRAMPYLPPRIASEGRGLDLTTNAWVSPDGKSVFVSAGTRPLTIPTAIDTFACLDMTA